MLRTISVAALISCIIGHVAFGAGSISLDDTTFRVFCER